MRCTPFLAIALFASHCGVEAGNTGKGRTGQVKISFAQESVTGSESLSVSVSSLGLLDSDDTEQASLTSDVSSVDLYASDASESVLVADSSEIPVGTYTKLAIRLKGDKPVKYRDAEGIDHDVELDADTRQSFYITQEIQVVEGEVTNIVVNLDPYQSLAKPSNDRYVFEPRGGVSRHSELGYEGSTDFTRNGFACLYAYQIPEENGPLGPMTSQIPEDEFDPWNEGGEYTPGGGPRRDGPHLLGPGGGKGREVERRPRFESREELVKDETSDCSKAYAKTVIKNGKFEFRYLSEGLYALRIFATDESYQDAVDDISLKAEN